MEYAYKDVLGTSLDLLFEPPKRRPRTTLTTRLRWKCKEIIHQFKGLSTTKRILIIIGIALTVLVICVVVPAVVVNKTPAVPMYLYVPSINCPDYTSISANQAKLSLNGTIQILSNMMNATHSRHSFTITLKYLASIVLIVSTNTSINWNTYNLQTVTLTGTPNACILYIGDSTPQLLSQSTSTDTIPDFWNQNSASSTTVTDSTSLQTTLTGTKLFFAFLTEEQIFVSDSVSLSATASASYMSSLSVLTSSDSLSLNQAITHSATMTSIDSSAHSVTPTVSASNTYSASSTRSTTVTASASITYSASSTRSTTVTASAPITYSASSTRSTTVTVSASRTNLASSTNSANSKKLVLVFLKFKDETSTLQPAQTLLNLTFGQNSAFENVNAIIQRLSSGSTSYVGINSTLPNASNWTVINRSMYSGCDTTYYSSVASSYLSSMKTSISSYDNVIVVLSSTLKCISPPFTLFSISTMILISQNSLTSGSSAITLTKNLLSNSGLGTADLLSCNSGFSNWTLCNPQTSKDPYDLMGSQALAPAYLQMSSRDQLGWLPTRNVLVLSDASTIKMNLVSMNYAALSDISFITYPIFTLLGKTRIKANYTLELQPYINSNGSLLCGVVVRMSRNSLFKYYIASLDISNPNYIDQDNMYTVNVISIQFDCSQASILIQTYRIAPSTLSIVDSRPTIMLFGYYAQNPIPTLNMFWLRDFYFGNNLTRSDNTRNINHIYARNSLNYTQFVGLNSVNVDVYPVWIPLTNVPSDCTNACSVGDWFTTLIAASGIVRSQYKHVIMTLGSSCGCPFAGVAELGGNAVLMNSYANYDTDYAMSMVLSHEIGHNLQHSGSADDISTGRSESEYGDSNDIMGNDYSERPNFGVRNRINAGWLSTDNLAVVSAPGNSNYTIINTQLFKSSLSYDAQFGVKVKTNYFELYKIYPWYNDNAIACSIIVRDTIVNNGGAGWGGGYDIVSLNSHILVTNSTYSNSVNSVNLTVVSIASDCSSAVVNVITY